MNECMEVKFFISEKVNAGLYRMRFIFGLFLCQ